MDTIDHDSESDHTSSSLVLWKDVVDHQPSGITGSTRASSQIMVRATQSADQTGPSSNH